MHLEFYFLFRVLFQEMELFREPISILNVQMFNSSGHWFLSWFPTFQASHASLKTAEEELQPTVEDNCLNSFLTTALKINALGVLFPVKGSISCSTGNRTIQIANLDIW